MKILYIGNYEDGTGWGEAAIHNIMCLSKNSEVTVVPRSITFNGCRNKNGVPQEIRMLEDNDLRNVDICVQHTLPSLYSYQRGFKNVGIYYSETNNIDSMLWHKYINLLDSSVVCNKQMAQAASQSGVTKPIAVCPIPINYDFYQNIEPSTTIKDIETSFNFCFVGEMTKRKNISTILRAFHTEFHPSENVNLFLKLNIPGLNSKEILAKFDDVNKGVTDGLKIRNNYKKIAVVTGMLDKMALASIMKQCHIFVCSSFGEAWCIPAMEAMAMGIPVIYPAQTGMEDFCYGWSVATDETICHGAVDSMPEIYSSFDTWQEMNTMDLMYIMRASFEAWNTMRDLFAVKQEKARRQALLYSYENIGKTLKGAICHPQNM